MKLTEKINQDLIAAMKAKDEVKLRAIRAIKAAFLLAGTETGDKEISDETALKAIKKMAKQRKDSIEIFSKENRSDLVKKESEELEILETYLPPELSKEEIELVLRNLIQQTGASGMKDIGKVMPLAMKELSANADGKLISELLRALLSS